MSGSSTLFLSLTGSPVLMDLVLRFPSVSFQLRIGNSLGAFWHKQDSTLVAEQTAISSIFAFFVSIYSVFVERPG